MIDLFILYLHYIGALYAFTKNWQEDNIKQGFLSVLILGLAFTILWALSGQIAFMIFPDSWNTIYFTKDTLSLVLLVIPESIFFYHFFIKK
ncbi:MAG: hypothetical protein ACOVNU_07150 [Candidatus Kapaibacteriota bacterium]|jgi:hypothetical protein